MSQIEEIKEKLDIVEVIRSYINVRAVGVNFQAKCPFHNEKTPSFVISPDKQIWHCFGCGRGGDIFSFVMEKEGLSFGEALRLLADKAGVVLEHEKKEEYSKRNRLLDLLDLTGKYYSKILESSAGKEALDYLYQRGLDDKTIKEWRLGYSPQSWDSLYKFLKTRPLSGQKYSDEEIALAGLTIKREGKTSYYDRFRGRIMFPIFDVNNNLIAFTARLKPESEESKQSAKYINSPKTFVYDKGNMLFALNKAKASIRKEDSVILVEGQMDAITCHQFGFSNVVASSGTALSGEQLKLLKRFTNNIIFAFDMDKAGQMAADRGIREALRQELNVKVLVLPEGKDPDESLHNNPDDFQVALQETKPILEYYFDKITAGLDLSLLDNKKEVADKMLDLIILVKNGIEQDYWIKRTAEDLDINEEILRSDLQKKLLVINKQILPERDGEKVDIKHQSREDKLAELLLALLLKSPSFINYSINNLDPKYITRDEYSRFYKLIIIYYNKHNSLDYNEFRLYLINEGQGDEKLLDRLILLGEKDLYDYDSVKVKAEIITIIITLKKYYYQSKIQFLEKELKQAESNNDEEEINDILQEVKSLNNKLKEIK